MAKQDSSNPVEFPATADDGWWAAVLAEVEGLTNTNLSGAERRAAHADGSKAEGRDAINWDGLLRLLEEEIVVTCTVVARNQGGLIVEHEDFQGFVPASHLITVNINPAKSDRNELLGTSLTLKVIECDPSRGRVILSERAAQTAPGESRRLLAKISEGNILQGSVTNITKFGVFVDIGGVEGLVHISELSWRRVGSLHDLVKLDQKVEALVMRVDRERSRVALSMKRLRPNPWESALDRFRPGDVLEAEVTEVVRFGAFAQVGGEIDGLIHISEMKLDKGVHPWKVYQKGQKVSVQILKVDVDKQRLSLGLVSTA
jgi:small subunit ribosomal protein S1